MYLTAGSSSRAVCSRLLAAVVGSNPAGGMDSFLFEYCVLSGKGLCDGPIARPEQSYRLWCVVVCDIEASRMKRPWPALGGSATKKMYLTSVQPLSAVCFRLLNYS
jgi:hypothetical protein